MKNNKLISILDLVLSFVLITVGLVVIINIDIFKNVMPWIMIGFFLIKIVMAIFDTTRFKNAKLYKGLQVLFNLIIIVLVAIFYSNIDALSFVIGASCISDLVLNLIKLVICRKSKDESSFFGIENIIYILFIVLLFINKDGNLLATSIIFGIIILYKGISNLISNNFFRKLVCLTDLGKAVNKIHGLDVLFGLLIVVTLASFILPYIEPGIPTAGDSWWYCFALITTIGFGDMVAVTTIGRILSVIIGFYGIIIVSLLTSAIVVYITSKNSK